MDAMRFGSAVGSGIDSRIDSGKSRRRKICRSVSSVIEGLEPRMMLTAAAITVTGNSQNIAFNGATSLANNTDFFEAPSDASITLTRTFTIGDAAGATGTLTLSGMSPVTITGADASDFTVTQPNGSTLPPGSTVPFSISYTPTAGDAQLDTATVTIASNDPTHPSYSFGIQAESVLPVHVSGATGLEYYTSAAGVDFNGGNPIKAQDGDLLVMDYSGYLTSGTVFDTSESPANGHFFPFEFILGANTVIQGWEDGIVGMEPGETRTLFIPSALGYGSSGQGSIPANATLIFTVTLDDVVRVAAVVNSNDVTISGGEDTPSTSNGTDFGVFDDGAAGVTNNYIVTDYGAHTTLNDARDLNLIFGNPAITITGVGAGAFSSTATTAEPTVTTTTLPNGVGDITTATIGVTYTPSPGISDAIFDITNGTGYPALSSNLNSDFTFEIQGQGLEPATGNVDSATWGEISGWTYDPENPTASINVEVSIAGGVTQNLTADLSRSDLTGVIGSPYHGFTYYVGFLSAGVHSYSVYAIDTTTNTDVLIGTGTITSQNSLFDPGYYLRTYPAVAAAVTAGTFTNGYQHYLQYGQFEGYSPSPFWDESWYLSQNPDIAAAVKAGTVSSGFMQYYLYGQYENRGGLLFFNQAYYLSTYPSIATAIQSGGVTSAYEQFVLYGEYEGLSPMLYFSSTVCDENNGYMLPDASGAVYTSDYDWFIEGGQFTTGGVTVSNFYNETTYLADNSDVQAAVTAGKFPDGFMHWLEYGQYEGRTA
jgi:hypothetical protein